MKTIFTLVYILHSIFLIVVSPITCIHTLDLKLDDLTDKQIIQYVDEITNNKTKNDADFLKLQKWVINECHKIIHPNYKKFCVYFVIKQNINLLSLKEYHLYKDEIMFIFNLLLQHKIYYSKNIHKILLYHINNQEDREKLKLLKTLSKINSRWSFLLFIRIKESFLTIARFKEKLLVKYSCISLTELKLIYNILPKQQKKYPLIYLFYLYKKLKTMLASSNPARTDKKGYTAMVKKMHKTTLLLLNKIKLQHATENYYIIWQLAIKYLPINLLKKYVDMKLIKDRKILSYIIYYGKFDLLPPNIQRKLKNLAFWHKTYKNKKFAIIPKRHIKNRIAFKSLLWLWANQEEEGKWIASKHNPFHGNFELPFFEGYEDLWYDIAETSLAIIAFTSSGFTHKSKNIFGDALKKAINWIIKNQNKEGLIDIQETPYEFLSGQYKEPFSRRKHGSMSAASLYNHNISLYALTELYLSTGDKKLLLPLKKAYKYALIVKYPIIGIPKSLNLDDIGPAVFLIIPLILLNKSGILVDNKAIDYIKKYISVMEKENTGQVFALSPVPRCLGNYDSVSALLTMKGLLAMSVQDSQSISKSLKFIHNHIPKWNPFYKVPKRRPSSMADSFFNDDDILNEFYWFFATTAFKFYDNKQFIKWYNRLIKILQFHQRNFGIYFGSFDPEGPWSKVAGRIYMNSIAVLILQSPYLFNYRLFRKR